MARKRVNIPIRTCVSCGKKREKETLLRLVLNEEGELKLDISGKAQGRGAYICEKKACIEGLNRNRRLGRLFKNNESIRLSSDLLSFISDIRELSENNMK